MTVIRITKDDYGDELSRVSFDVEPLRLQEKGYSRPGANGSRIFISAKYFFPAGCGIQSGDILLINNKETSMISVRDVEDIFRNISYVEVEV